MNAFELAYEKEMNAIYSAYGEEAVFDTGVAFRKNEDGSYVGQMVATAHWGWESGRKDMEANK